MSQSYTLPTMNVEKPNLKVDDLLHVMKYRYATKAFDNTKEIPAEEFAHILDAAQLSPTSFGLEAFKLVVIQNKEVREQLRKYAWGAQNALANASHFVAILANKKVDLTFGSAYMDHMLKEVHELPQDVYDYYSEAYTTFSTKHFKIAESDRAAFDWSAKQGYIVLANMMTMAAYQGIDSCAIEGFIPAEFDRILGTEQGLYDTDHYGVSVCVAFGYRDETPHRDKSRRPLSESIVWSK